MNKPGLLEFNSVHLCPQSELSDKLPHPCPSLPVLVMAGAMIRTLLRISSKSAAGSLPYNAKSYRIAAFATTTTQAPTTMTAEKMAHDKRYQAVSEVPENVLNAMNSNVIHSPGFSIKVERRYAHVIIAIVCSFCPLSTGRIYIW